MNTPSIIKYPFMRMTAASEQAAYVCVDLGGPWAPDEIAGRSILISADADRVINDLTGSPGS